MISKYVGIFNVSVAVTYIIFLFYSIYMGYFELILSETSWIFVSVFSISIWISLVSFIGNSPVFNNFKDFLNPQGHESVWPFVYVMLPTLVISISLFWHEYATATQTSEHASFGPASVMMAASFATLGWYMQFRNSRMVQARRHSLMFVLDYRNTTVFKEHLQNVLSSHPYGTSISAEDMVNLLKKEKSEILISVLYLINFYEFMAISILSGDVEEKLLLGYYKNILLKFYRKFAHVLYDSFLDNPSDWRHLRFMVYKWSNNEMCGSYAGEFKTWDVSNWHATEECVSVESLDRDRGRIGLGRDSVLH